MSPNDKDKDMINNTNNVDGDSTEYKKIWLVEWKNAFGITFSEERYDYAKALAIFDTKVSKRIEAILYEIQKSPVDSAIIKKIPILNSVKAQKRKEDSDSDKNADIVKQRAKGNNKSGRIRYRIILLIIVFGALVLVLSLISALTNEGGIIINPQVAVPMVDTTKLLIIPAPASYTVVNV